MLGGCDGGADCGGFIVCGRGGGSVLGGCDGGADCGGFIVCGREGALCWVVVWVQS